MDVNRQQRDDATSFEGLVTNVVVAAFAVERAITPQSLLELREARTALTERHAREIAAAKLAGREEALSEPIDF